MKTTQPFNRRQTLIGLLLILALTGACTALPPTPTRPAAPSETPAPTPTFTAPPATPTHTPAPPAAAELRATVEAGLMPTPTPDASGRAPASITQVGVLPLEVSKGSPPLWAVYSFGNRYFEANQYHFVALYTHDGDSWQELARLELAPNFDIQPQDPGADYLFDNSVSQVFVAPSRIWLQVEGSAGAHSGTYHLLSFDGQTLKVELASFSPSPGAAGLADVNDDGALEVVLDASDPYVFCYACGVRKIAFQIYAWDEADARLWQVSLQPLSTGQSQPVRDAVNPAIELAQAGLWQDALAQIVQAKELLPHYPGADALTLDWNYAFIKLHAEAMAQEVADSAYPLLSNVFYGDYAAALDLMRPYSMEQLFGPDSPLVKDTVAEGWEQTLSDWIVKSTTQALAIKPDLAAAYFVRGWAVYLIDPSNFQAVADVERAARLAPDEPLFAQVNTEDLRDKTLTEFEIELLTSGYAAQTRKFSQADVTYRASFYTHAEWYANPNYLLIAKTQGEQTTVVYQLQEARRFLLTTYGAQGQVNLDWMDMNADGLMELAYVLDQGGNCWTCSEMQVLQLRADDSVVSLTESVPPEDGLGESFIVLSLLDADDDGAQEWLVLDARFEFAFNLCHACSPVGFRLYAWDGESYRNASAQFPDYYQQQIDDLTVQIEQMAQSQSPWTGSELGPIVSLLLAYENAGRQEEGLALFEQYSDPAQYEGRLDEAQLQSLQEAREFFLPTGGD